MELALTYEQVRSKTRSLFLTTMRVCDAVGSGQSALDEYRDCIVRYLEQCGGCAEEVAYWCDDRGIKGCPGYSRACVIANLITYAFGCDAIVGDDEFTITYGNLCSRGTIPGPVRTFISLFDGGKFSYLREREGVNK